MWIVLIGTGVAFLGAGIAVSQGIRAQDIALIGFIAFGSVIVLFAGAVLYKIGIGDIELQGIIAEPRTAVMTKDEQPKASLSRFQFLVFTFVVAGLFLMLSIEAGQFVNIPNNVLVLIGLSGTGYLAGKVVSPNQGDEPPEDPKKNAERMQNDVDKLEEELAAAKAKLATATKTDSD